MGQRSPRRLHPSPSLPPAVLQSYHTRSRTHTGSHLPPPSLPASANNHHFASSLVRPPRQRAQFTSLTQSHGDSNSSFLPHARPRAGSGRGGGFITSSLHASAVLPRERGGLYASAVLPKDIGPQRPCSPMNSTSMLSA